MLVQKDGKWAFVSRKTRRPLAYYRGEGKPSEEWVRKQEQRVQYFKHMGESFSINEYTITSRQDFFDDGDLEEYISKYTSQKNKYKKVRTPVSDLFDVRYLQTGLYHDYVLFDKKTGKAVGLFGLDEKPIKQQIVKSGVGIVIPHLMLNKEYQNKGIGKRIYQSFLGNSRFVYATNEHTREAKILWDSMGKLPGIATQTVGDYRFLGRKEFFTNLNEVAYVGNVGFQELIKFHSKATPTQKKQLQSHIQNKKHKEFRDLIKHVTGVELHKSVSEEYGAGEDGTDKLRKKYQKDTPGQNVKSFKGYMKTK
jgi:hypothetical protein